MSEISNASSISDAIRRRSEQNRALEARTPAVVKASRRWNQVSRMIHSECIDTEKLLLISAEAASPQFAERIEEQLRTLNQISDLTETVDQHLQTLALDANFDDDED